MNLVDQSGQIVPIFLEQCADEGVKKLAGVLACDIELVSDQKPEIIDETAIGNREYENLIIVATIGKSKVLEKLANTSKIDYSGIEGKWECFMTSEVNHPFEGVEKAVVIIGSDKRGTIYGMFSLSEAIGVSPLVFWGDVLPAKNAKPVLTDSFYKTSKEPSVRYRGFFINDEWPCFGNWVFKHYGGFNATMYEQVFIFLLRMKGNYMWPAMWTSSFSLDGPGSADEELADLMGVVMGYSHHEPCLRASEEWDKVKGADTKYGKDWNYVLNKEGLLNYWEDALIRSGKYDNMITIGMRGERDTSMLGPDSTMQQNVELLKEIITNQKKMIDQHVRPLRPNVPLLLALYKEVEDYFYGDDKVDGLQNWEGLSDVICMLCEDNHGHMRTLPTQKMRDKKQKFGMYYHFDYHGDPVSYEWVDSTPFTKIWEQMCQAYEFGIREVWIVNVGDLKFHEVPLTYFMELAYDFEQWGTSNDQSVNQYLAKWAKMNFPKATEELQAKIAFDLREYIDCNHIRRPESLHAGIFHPAHFEETDRMLARVQNVIHLTHEIMRELATIEEKNAFYSCIGFSALASMNHMKMHLLTGKNQFYASQGRQIANDYKCYVEACMLYDKEIYSRWSTFLDGKWEGMQYASHIGFTQWNDFGRRNPVLSQVYPVENPRMNVSRKDHEKLYEKIYGPAMTIEVDDFKWPGCDSVRLEIANDGLGMMQYHITGRDGEIPAWLHVSSIEGRVEKIDEITLAVKRDCMESEEAETTLMISDGDTSVAVHVSVNRCSEIVREDKKVTEDGYEFYPQKHACIMRADHFYKKQDVENGAFRVIDQYGKYGAGVKAFPVTNYYEKGEGPAITYRFMVETSGEYEVRFYLTPTNAMIKGEEVRMCVETDQTRVVTVLPTEYRAGVNSDRRWANGVLDQIRIVSLKQHFEKGFNEITVRSMEPGLVLQQIGVFDSCYVDDYAYLGQEESYWNN